MIDEVRVDAASIERSLAGLWRAEHQAGKEPVTRAALWNVVAHTSGAQDGTHAGRILSSVAATIPQRTIVLRSEAGGEPEIAAWISANCHLLSGEKQVCSEEISIAARGGAHDRLPPLVHALLIPDMPVAVWWVGRLPAGSPQYVEALLEVADRLIVDSAQLESIDDLLMMFDLARRTGTSLADLNWVRLEEWRQATAAVFDPPAMQTRLQHIRAIRLTRFEPAQAALYAAWLIAQAGLHVKRVSVILNAAERDRSPVAGEPSHSSPRTMPPAVEVEFDSGPPASLSLRDDEPVIVGGCDAGLECVTRMTPRRLEDLLIRQLKQPRNDAVFLRALAVTRDLRQ